MCFKQSGRAARLQMIQSSMQIEQQKRLQADQLAQQERHHQEEVNLQKRALTDQKKQNDAILKSQEKANEISQRPAPPPPPPSAVMVTGGMTADTDTIDSAEELRRNGRRSLRIDLNAPGGSSGATGLNIPRG